MSTIELKPCAHCGNSAQREERMTDGDIHRVICSHCDIATLWMGGRCDIEIWNTRANEAKAIPNPLDLTKPVQTRSGKPVRILCTDAKGEGPIVGLIHKGPCDDVMVWNSAGKIYSDGMGENDLMNVPEQKKIHTAYFVIQKITSANGSSFIAYGYPDFGTAEENINLHDLACIKVEFEEGYYCCKIDD